MNVGIKHRIAAIVAAVLAAAIVVAIWMILFYVGVHLYVNYGVAWFAMYLGLVLYSGLLSISYAIKDKR